MSLSLPERILKELGIDEPQDINLQQLYEKCNLTLMYAEDMSAHAEIMIGPNNHGIIPINQKQHLFRQRFSIAHELGHWHLHKNLDMFACDTSHGSSKTFFDDESGKLKERQADKFAANLLLPPYILKPYIKGLSKINFSCIKNLSETFQTSISATASQLVNIREHPILVAVYKEDGSLWYFNRSELLKECLWPPKTISKGMYAYDVFTSQQAKSGLISAVEWFEGVENEIDIFEESIYWHGHVISIINATDNRLWAG